ncbi:MAG: asparagine synthase-related protein, partial [Candidatus Methanospirareceae archaeon]
MCRIIGVFNNDKAKELVIKGLRCVEGDERDIWFFSKGRNSLGCSFSLCASSGEKEVKREDIVADAEIFNYEELKARYGVKGEEELLICLLKGDSLDEIDGAFAFAYWQEEEDAVYIARDRIGLKPIWYCHSEGFAFASEKKMLKAMGFAYGVELNPRVILKYDIKEDRIRFLKEDFRLPYGFEGDEEEIKKRLFSLLMDSVSKRVKNERKVGVLFSGGLDSSLIAYTCKKLGMDFVCYTVAFEGGAMKEAEDLRYAREVAEDLGLELKVKKVGFEDVERYLRKVVPLIEDVDVVKVEVAIPIYIGCEMAKEDGLKVLLYGLGTEELFAGYERHRRVKKEELNKECFYGLLRMHERDLYRDEVVAKANKISLRAPFLAKDIVEYALR